MCGNFGLPNLGNDNNLNIYMLSSLFYYNWNNMCVLKLCV
jgi:hypothetical protein